MSVATGEGRMCSVSDAETSARLGFVLCDALEMGAGTGEAPSSTSRPAQAPVASPQPASPHDGPVAALDQLKGAGRIYLVQMGDHVLPYSLEDFATWLHAKYGLEVHVLPPAAINKSAWDPQRRQYVAELLYGQMKTDHPNLASDPHAFLIGFTDADMYAIRRASKSSLTERDLKRAAIISAEGMDECPNGEPSPQCLQGRLRRILLKNVAILYWNLPLSYDPSSLLHSPLDIDLPTEEIYASDLDPARNSWGQHEGEPCIFFSYSKAAGIRPLPGAFVHSCWGSEDEPHDESQEFFEVDLRLGVLIDRHSDFDLPDTVPIQFDRVLRDGWRNLNPFGISGSDNYDEYLSSPDNITISIVGADTSREDVVRVPRNQTNLSLAKYIDTGTGKYYEMRWFALPYERYELSDASRRLVQLSSPHNSWLHFHYGPLGGIASIEDSRGRTVHYGYDVRNRLVSVTYPSGETFHYEYDESQHLLTFSVSHDVTATSVTILRNEYKGGKLTKQVLAGGAVYTYHYEPVGASEFHSATVQVSDGRVFDIDIDKLGSSTIHERIVAPAQ
jgi:YD repeat-containing protein